MTANRPAQCIPQSRQVKLFQVSGMKSTKYSINPEWGQINSTCSKDGRLLRILLTRVLPSAHALLIPDSNLVWTPLMALKNKQIYVHKAATNVSSRLWNV